MKIKSYAHASFRVEGGGKAIVTDPYEPAVAWFAPIDEPADLVLMSSDTDRFHCDPSHVQGNPKVINTLTVPPEGMVVDGIPIRAFPARERFQMRLIFRGFRPRANAMYSFELEGIKVFHTGDIGRRFRPDEIAALRGNVDVMIALSGGVHNIEVDDMKQAIDAIGPRMVIPMHYFNPKGRLKILPVDEIAKRFPADHVVRNGASEVEFTAATLPKETTLYILEPSR
ncbi:MAG TPA: MBL fold metallo-hydrolase [Thermoanaerobaculia bacterium]|nr:MBL fold metallo-hydrolase [Thermoanaerobaculia bacterium]